MTSPEHEQGEPRGEKTLGDLSVKLNQAFRGMRLQSAKLEEDRDESGQMTDEENKVEEIAGELAGIVLRFREAMERREIMIGPNEVGLYDASLYPGNQNFGQEAAGIVTEVLQPDSIPSYVEDIKSSPILTDDAQPSHLYLRFNTAYPEIVLERTYDINELNFGNDGFESVKEDASPVAEVIYIEAPIK